MKHCNLTVFAIIAVALLLATNAQAQAQQSSTGENGLNAGETQSLALTLNTSTNGNTPEVNTGATLTTLQSSGSVGPVAYRPAGEDGLYAIKLNPMTVNTRFLDHQNGLEKGVAANPNPIVAVTEKPPIPGENGLEKGATPASVALKSAGLQGEPGKVSRSMTSAQDGTDMTACASCHVVMNT